MKAISIKNPFANLVAMNYKTIETRVASSSVARTKHRGEVLICTSQGMHPFWNEAKMYIKNGNYNPAIDPYFKKACDKVWSLLNEDWDMFEKFMMYPMGISKVIATAQLVDIIDMEKEHQDAACCSLYITAKSIMMEDIKPIKPFNLTGRTNGFHLNVFEVNMNNQPIQYI